jgi:hypothetical protein
MAAALPPPDNNLIGWFVAAGGAVGTAGIAFWKWFSSSKLGQAGTNAQLDVIRMLTDQLNTERARADQYMKDRDAAFDTINQLKNQVAALTQQVQRLEVAVKASTPPSTPS